MNSPKSEAAGLNVADVYLDSCCFMYLVEGEPRWRSVVERLLRQLSSTTRLITSTGGGFVAEPVGRNVR